MLPAGPVLRVDGAWTVGLRNVRVFGRNFGGFPRATARAGLALARLSQVGRLARRKTLEDSQWRV